MKTANKLIVIGSLCVALAGAGVAAAGVSAQEAEKLKTTLTPFGGERAGNKEGTIPAWEGGYTTPIPGFVNGGKRPDPFADEKPLFSITSQNMDQYADKLSDGCKGMLTKYPDYRIDVYPTRRTAAAPEWVYENTFKNATRGSYVENSGGGSPKGVFGGIPFPIPQSPRETMWNHLLLWRGESIRIDSHGVLGTSDGKTVVMVDLDSKIQLPYYFEDGSPETFDGDYWKVQATYAGPPIRAGEGIVGRENVDHDKTQSWVYLPGQRRVRKLPNPSYDTPVPTTAGIQFFDEVEVFLGAMDRWDWKSLGKKELFIPYNTNRVLVPESHDEVRGAHFIKPEFVRWELHRVWAIEATLKPGERHQVARSVYYLDEDTWQAVLGDRWDHNGKLWRSLFSLPVVMPDLPATYGFTAGYYDLVSGSWFTMFTTNSKRSQFEIMPRYPGRLFTPDSLIGRSVR